MISLGNNRTTFLRCWRWNDWFFRVRGHGLSIEPLKGHRPMFSERNGTQAAWHRIGLCIKPLYRREVVR